VDNRDLPQLLSSGYQISFLEEKQPEHEIERSGPSNADVRQYVMGLCLIKHKGNCTGYFALYVQHRSPFHDVDARRSQDYDK
jgi:hypothetical protein